MCKETTGSGITANCEKCGKPLWWNGTTTPVEGTLCECNSKELVYPAGQTGWICPRCGTGVSPFATTCPCNFDYTVTTTNLEWRQP
jgi:hypothetical protein